MASQQDLEEVKFATVCVSTRISVLPRCKYATYPKRSPVYRLTYFWRTLQTRPIETRRRACLDSAASPHGSALRRIAMLQHVSASFAASLIARLSFTSAAFNLLLNTSRVSRLKIAILSQFQV